MRAAVAFVGLALAGAANVPAPVWPAAYTVSGVINLPYGNISEPFTARSDFNQNLQRIDYYSGLDTYIYRGDLNVSWQVNPTGYTYSCFENDGPVQVTTILPDLSTWTFIGAGNVNGVAVWGWQQVVTQYQKTSTYTMWLSQKDGSPQQLHLFGYDFVFGSHFDQYYIDFNAYSTTPFPPNTFDKPTASCGPMGGDSATSAARGQELFRELIPQSASGGALPQDATHDAAFNAFMAEHGRAYANEAELRQRHSIFTRNRRYISQFNRKSAVEKRSVRLAMNALGDATQAELAMRRGRSVVKAKLAAEGRSNGAHALHKEPTPETRAKLPTSVDWRTKGAVTIVPDQGICGSCWAHGATGMLEGQRAIKHGVLEVLSKQEVMDCSWAFGNNACDGGDDFLGYQWIMQNGGLSTKANYGPYLQADGFCHANKSGLPIAVQITSYVNVTSGSETALMDALANVGPISISIDAAVPSFDFYASGTYDDPACQSGMQYQDHTVLAVGYGTDANGVGYWIVRNNWSQYWGDGGYILIARQNNICGVATSPTYANIA